MAVEVIEHLDPPQVESLAGSMLGVLQPATAIVTTPNYEYNVVLQSISPPAAGGATLPAAAGGPAPASGGDSPVISLRNKDHRFEWWASDSSHCPTGKPHLLCWTGPPQIGCCKERRRVNQLL